MKNKILIFLSAKVYHIGGMIDVFGEANSLEEAESVIIKLLLKNDDIDGLVCWWQLVNKENLQIIKCSEDE